MCVYVFPARKLLNSYPTLPINSSFRLLRKREFDAMLTKYITHKLVQDYYIIDTVINLVNLTESIGNTINLLTLYTSLRLFRADFVVENSIVFMFSTYSQYVMQSVHKRTHIMNEKICYSFV